MISRSPLGAPAEQHQVVAHGVSEVTLVPEILQRHPVAPLRQFLPFLVDEYRHVRPDRGLVPKGLPEQLPLFRHVRQVLLGADDQGDPLADVIDDVGQQEQHRAVAAGDDEVLNGGVLERGFAADQIVNDVRTLIGGAEAQRPALARSEATIPAVPVVTAVLIAGPRDDVFPRAVAVIGLPLRVKPLRRRRVLGQVVRLQVRAFVLTVVYAQPRKRADDAVDPLRPVPRGVRVLNPEHQRAAGLQRNRPVEEDRSRAADMEHAGRRWRKAQSDVRTPASHGYQA